MRFCAHQPVCLCVMIVCRLGAMSHSNCFTQAASSLGQRVDASAAGP